MKTLLRRSEFWILLMGLTPLLWFRDGILVTGGDHVFPLDPGGFFLNRLNVWDHRLGVGAPSAIYATSLVYHGLQAACRWLGAALIDVQRLTYLLWFTALAASAYMLARAFQRARGASPDRAAALIAALAFTFNPVMFNVWEGGKAGSCRPASAYPWC